MSFKFPKLLVAALVLLSGARSQAWANSSSIRMTLAPGWNLVSAPPGSASVLEAFLTSHAQQVWPVDGFAEAEEGYWVFSKIGLDLDFEVPSAMTDGGSFLVRDEGWRFLRAETLSAEPVANVDRVLRWDRETQTYERVSKATAITPGEGYFVQFHSAKKRTFSEEPRAPTHLSASVHQKAVRLWWRAPPLFADGSEITPAVPIAYRLYRDGEPLATVSQKTHEDHVPELGKTYQYSVTAIAEDAGTAWESEPSAIVELPLFRVHKAAQEGTFESPSEVDNGHISASLLTTALSRDGQTVLAHLVYRGDTKAKRARGAPSMRRGASMVARLLKTRQRFEGVRPKRRVYRRHTIGRATTTSPGVKPARFTT